MLAEAPPNPPKVIIFDFDGVILDSADIKLRGYIMIYAAEDRRFSRSQIKAKV
jgi:beta-phosphoglucomutase-like phosphatase (HAD superfamily)